MAARDICVHIHTCMDTALCAYGQLTLGTGLGGRQTKAPPTPRRDWVGLSQAPQTHNSQTLLWPPANPIPHTVA